MATWKELKAIAEKDEAKEIHPYEAMRRLDPAFETLRSCKDGKAFLEEMERTFRQMEYSSIDREEISIHTIIGICQLAHHIRDSKISPSRKKSFRRVIPWLLDHRNKIRNKPPEDIVVCDPVVGLSFIMPPLPPKAAVSAINRLPALSIVKPNGSRNAPPKATIDCAPVTGSTLTTPGTP